MLKELTTNGAIWLAKANNKPQPCTKVLPFGIKEIDQQLPLAGLPYGHIHEWTLEDSLEKQNKSFWRAPLLIISTFLYQSTIINKDFGKKVCWIGRRCWPNPSALDTLFLKSQYNWQEDYLFIKAKKKEQRLWAAVEALHSKGASIVIADGSNFKMTESRKLQIAAQNSMSIAFILRPTDEINFSSVAYSKWRVSPSPSDNDNSKWLIERLRCRATPYPFSCFVEWSKENKLEISSREEEINSKNKIAI